MSGSSTPIPELLTSDLHRIIDDLAEADLDILSEAELETAAIHIQRERQRLAALSTRILQRWETSRSWVADGSASAASRLSRETRCSLRSARREIRRARQSRQMPAAVTAILDGDLSMDHLDLLAKGLTGQRRDQFSRDVTMLVEMFRTLPFRDAVTAMDYWCLHADATGSADPGDSEASSKPSGHLHASTTLDNTVVITGELDPVRGLIFTRELARLEREIFLADTEAGIERSTSARQAEALCVMATRSASTPAGAKKPRPLFTVLLGDQSFTALCELANTTVLPPAQLGRWLAEADLETVLFDGPSTVISVSQKRSFTGALRRAIEVRDRRCTHPSICEVPADRCDVDHIVPVSRGGPTSQFNGRMQCPTHNRNTALHDHGAQAAPHRTVTVLDQMRGRLRWQILRSAP